MSKPDKVVEEMKFIEAAQNMVVDLCHRDREWIMSIPARPDYDPDIVIANGLRVGKHALKLLEDKDKKLEKQENEILRLQDFLTHLELMLGEYGYGESSEARTLIQEALRVDDV